MKCTFLKTSVQYSGHIIDADGLHAAEEKVDAIVHAPESKNIYKLRSFLRLLNYYGHFIPNLSSFFICSTIFCNTSLRDGQKPAVKPSSVSLNVFIHYDSTRVIMNDISCDG